LSRACVGVVMIRVLGESWGLWDRRVVERRGKVCDDDT
jgi:hypothetical protein